MSQPKTHDEAERWGTVFMGPTSDRESSIDKVANREQCEIWNRQAEAEYMERVRARAAMRVEAMLDKARTNSTVIRRTAEEWADKVRLRWEDLHADARREQEQARQLREEAERLRENAYAEGYQMGVEQAMMELDAHRAQLDAMTAAVLSAIQGQCGSFYTSWRTELAALLREAVETSVGWVLTEERAAVLDALLTGSVQALENRQKVQIRVHPDDEAALHEVLDGTRQRFAEVGAWDVVVDPVLHPGGLVVESVSGKVDNLADSRLSLVEQVLHHLTLPVSEVDAAAVAAVDEAAREAGLTDLVRDVAEREEAERELAARQEEERQTTLAAETANVEPAEAGSADAVPAGPDPVAALEADIEQLTTLSAAAMAHPLVQNLTHEAALPPGETWEEAIPATPADVPAEESVMIDPALGVAADPALDMAADPALDVAAELALEAAAEPALVADVVGGPDNGAAHEPLA